MYNIEYSALKYYNNIISDECLYIGMLFHNLTTGERVFKHISNFKRFRMFDDEVDVDFVKSYLNGIKQQVERNILNYQDDFSIFDYTSIFVNEFRFTKAISIEVAEDEDYVDKFTKMYLKFDFNKNQRLSAVEEKKYIKKILASSNVEFSEPKISGIYDENVTFDYVIGDVAIKLFSFKQKKAAKLVPAAKQWAFSAAELKDKYKIVFLYVDDNDDMSLFKPVMRILSENAIVYKLQDGLDYVLKAVS